jgi:hypothetical protein
MFFKLKNSVVSDNWQQLKNRETSFANQEDLTLLHVEKLVTLLRNLMNLNELVMNVEKWSSDEYDELLKAYENTEITQEIMNTNQLFVTPQSKKALKDFFFSDVFQIFSSLSRIFFRSSYNVDEQFVLRVGDIEKFAQFVVKKMVTYIITLNTILNVLCTNYQQHSLLNTEELRQILSHNFLGSIVYVDKSLDFNFAPSDKQNKTTKFTQLTRVYSKAFDALRGYFRNLKFQHVKTTTEFYKENLSKMLNSRERIEITKTLPTFILEQQTTDDDPLAEIYSGQEMFEIDPANNPARLSTASIPDFLDLSLNKESCTRGFGDNNSEDDDDDDHDDDKAEKSCENTNNLTKAEKAQFTKEMTQIYDKINSHLTNLQTNLASAPPTLGGKSKNTEIIYKELNSILDLMIADAEQIQSQIVTSFESTVGELKGSLDVLDSKVLEQTLGFDDKLQNATKYMIEMSTLVKPMLEKFKDLQLNISNALNDTDRLQTEIAATKILVDSSLKFQLNTLKTFDYVLHNFLPFEILPHVWRLAENLYDKYSLVKRYCDNENVHLQINGFVMTPLETRILESGEDAFFKQNQKISSQFEHLYDQTIRKLFFFYNYFIYNMRDIDMQNQKQNQVQIVKNKLAIPIKEAALSKASTESSTKFLKKDIVLLTNESELTTNPNRYIKCISSVLLAGFTTPPSVTNSSKANAAAGSGLFLLQNFLNHVEMSVVLELSRAILSGGSTNELDESIVSVLAFYVKQASIDDGQDVAELVLYDLIRILMFILVLYPRPANEPHVNENGKLEVHILNASLKQCLKQLVDERAHFVERLRTTDSIEISKRNRIDQDDDELVVRVGINSNLNGELEESLRFRINEKFFEHIDELVDGEFPNLIDYLEEETNENADTQTSTRNVSAHLSSGFELKDRYAILNMLKSKIYGSTNVQSIVKSDTSFFNLQPINHAAQQLEFVLIN